MTQENEQNLLTRLIEETIDNILEQNILSAGGITGTTGSPIHVKPFVFDPEKPKKRKHNNKNK